MTHFTFNVVSIYLQHESHFNSEKFLSDSFKYTFLNVFHMRNIELEEKKALLEEFIEEGLLSHDEIELAGYFKEGGSETWLSV